MVTTIIILIHILENILIYYIYGTFCRMRKMEYMEYVHEIKIESELVFAKSPMILNCLLVLTASTIHNVFKFWSKYKRGVQILPTVTQNQELISYYLQSFSSSHQMLWKILNLLNNTTRYLFMKYLL